MTESWFSWVNLHYWQINVIREVTAKLKQINAMTILPKQMNKTATVLFAMYLAGSGHSATTFEDWKSKHDNAFKDFTTEQAREFREWKEHTWRSFQATYVATDAYKPISPPTKRVIPEYPTNASSEPSSMNEGELRPFVSIELGAQNRLDVTFFDDRFSVPFIDVTGLPIPYEKADVQAVLNFLEDQDLHATTTQVKQYIHRNSLNVYDEYLIYEAISLSTVSNVSLQEILMVELLRAAGYQAQIGFTDGQAWALIPSEQPLLNIPKVRILEDSYYAIHAPTTLATLEVIKLAGNRISEPLNFTPSDKLPLLSGWFSKTFTWPLNGVQQSIDVPVNAQLAHYYDSVPAMPLETMTSIPMYGELFSIISASFKQTLVNLDNREKVEWLLAFTQGAFSYKTDKEQFGRENYLFASESFFFGSNDCEDRSIILFQLINSLTDSKAALVVYNGHVAAAVGLPSQPGDTTLNINGQTFIVADPTYIGASLGESIKGLSVKKAIL